MSGNTRRFVQKIDREAVLCTEVDWGKLDRPVLLITPTYSDGRGRNAIPKEWDRLLDDAKLHHWVTGIVSCGDRSFTNTFVLGGKQLAKRLGSHVVREVELSGLPSDVRHVQDYLDKWK